MTPQELNLIGTMIVAGKPAGVSAIEIAHRSNGFTVSMVWRGNRHHVSATETGPTLFEAFAKANVSRLRKIAAARSAADIADAEFGPVFDQVAS